MTKNLYERLLSIEPNVKVKAIDSLLKSTVNATAVAEEISSLSYRHYIEPDLVTYIENYFLDKNVNLTNYDGSPFNAKTQLKPAINKVPLKLVGYGIGNSSKFPTEILERLSAFENVYLLAGVWNEKQKTRNPEKYNSKTIVEMVCDLIESGLNSMEEVHKNVDVITKGKTHYVTEPLFPYSTKIRKEIANARSELQSEFDRFVTSLEPLYDEAGQLKKKMGELPLFSSGFEKPYSDIIIKIRDLVSNSSYPEEFVKRFKGIFGLIK